MTSSATRAMPTRLPHVERAWGLAAGRVLRVCCAALIAHTLAQAHEPGADAVPETPGWRLGAAAALLLPDAGQRWPAARWPGVMTNGSTPREQRGGVRLEHGTLDLTARLDRHWGVHAALGWHDRDTAHAEALRVQARWAVGPDELELGLGRDTVRMGAVIDGAGHFDRFSQPPLAKRAVLNDTWIDDGVTLALRRSVEDGVRALDAGVWRGSGFPGGPAGDAVPAVHMHAGWGHLDAHLAAAHLAPRARGAAINTSATGGGHLHGRPDCRVSLQQRVCFDGQVDVLGASVHWEAERGDWLLALAGLARRERGALYSVSSDTRYRATVAGAWADMVWQPGGAWTVAGRLERLMPRSQLSGVGATVLAREAGLADAAVVRRLAFALSHRLPGGLQVALEAGQEDAGGVRARHVALRMLWNGATMGSLPW